MSTKVVTVPGAPAIPALRFRQPSGAADLTALAEAQGAAYRADGLEDRQLSAEDLARRYDASGSTGWQRNLLLAEIDQAVVAWTGVWWQMSACGEMLLCHEGFVMSAWRRRGLGRALLRHAEFRLQEIAIHLPNCAERFFQATTLDRETGREALLSASNYVPVHAEWTMRRDDLSRVPAVALPPGLEIRFVTPEQYHAVWAAMREAFRGHWSYGPPTAEDFRRWAERPDLDAGLWQVAWDGDQVAGMVLSRVSEAGKTGWIYDVAVLPPWRRRGLARGLLSRSLQTLRSRGMSAAALCVDAENPQHAYDLYLDLGFRGTETERTWRKRIP